MRANNLLSKEKDKKVRNRLVRTFTENKGYDRSLHSQENNKYSSIALDL